LSISWNEKLALKRLSNSRARLRSVAGDSREAASVPTATWWP